MRSATRADRARRGAGCGDDRGSAAAEFAVALPAVVLVLAMVFGGVQLGALHLQAADAAADAARAAARDEPSIGAQVANRLPGAGVRVEQRGDLVCARVEATAQGAAGRLGVVIAAESCALGGGR